MSIRPDSWIKYQSLNNYLINPFVDEQVSNGVISYGVSSYGYDVRCADEFKIFTNINSTVLDPKNLDENSFVDFKGDVCIIPPNSFALTRTVETVNMPDEFDDDKDEVEIVSPDYNLGGETYMVIL